MGPYLNLLRLWFFVTGAAWAVLAAPALGVRLAAQAPSAPANLRIVNGTDTVLPTVSITAPAAGATVTGSAVTVAASASDAGGVKGVQFKLDGANLGAEDTAAPYSVSWNTIGVPNGSHSLVAVARDAAGNRRTSVAVSVTVSNAAPPPGGGLAALYPGDVGIEADSDVVFVERFEDAALSGVFARWTEVLNGPAMSLAADVPPGSPGSRSLNIPWVGGGVNDGGHLYKQLSPGVDDTLYVRYYIKYPTAGTYQHTGIWMGGYNPPLAWPNPQAGVKPAGNDRFIAAAEQNNLTLRFDHYDYWMNMRQSGDGKYWGNLLLNDATVQARSGQWTCVEHMVKLNNPVTASNGEHAIWIDGVKVSHLGQGFPNGSWSGGIFTQNPGGSPFEGLRWRSDSNLRLNWIWLQNYASVDPAGFNGTMKFDHVVAARSYIGCLTSGPPSTDTTAPTVAISAPLAGALLSGSGVTVSATASDNVGVAGVQFKVDGASTGAEDTTAPYSYSLNTTLLSNGTHTLTATARDAAGNQTTSAPVTVTISNLVGSLWPNEPAGFRAHNDQPWNLLIGNGWNYLRRTASKNADIVTDLSAPFSPLSVMRMIFTTDVQRDTEPGVHWIGLPGPTEAYAGWWMKVSPNWTCSPAGCGKISFFWTAEANGAGVTYANLAGVNDLHYINIATTWPSTGYRFWEPNVTKTNVLDDQWYRVEWYVKWASSSGASDGIVRWWVNGVLNGDYRNVPFPAIRGFIEFQFASTRQDPPPTEQYMYIDHTRISIP